MIEGELAKRADELRSERAPFVVATVVRAQRPTSVRPGDAAIVLADGTIEGFVGGVCAEASVRLQALRTLETGEALLLRILPLDGEPDGGAAVDEGAVTVQNPCLSGGALEIFLEPRPPVPRLVVVGDTPIAHALAELGARMDYKVVRRTSAEWEPTSGEEAVIVASHGRDEERPLASALREGVPYVGLVASSVRGEAVRAALDVADVLRAQLRTPAGFDIGARTPAEIAVAILAEIVASRGDRADRHGGRPASTASASGDPGQKVTVDPVCGMEVAVSDASVHVDLAGQRFYFCSRGCREAFAADAARHADVA